MEKFNAVGFKIFNIPEHFFFARIGLVVLISILIVLMAENGYSLPKIIRNMIVPAVNGVYRLRIR